MLYASNGSAYGGQGGIIGAFVKKANKENAKTCIALMDSGLAASQLGVNFSGFALLGFEDSNHAVSMGLLDLVEGMVLVPKADDPDPLYPPTKDNKEEEVKKTGAKLLYNMSQQKYHMNLVESTEGYMMSLIDGFQNKENVTNHFDLSRAKHLN